ncbi:MAG: hypothetical protein DCC49_06150 [Acidobacteria bacterium]|nr:MAG: hypothetical protein DCC49_06150 [Acidobacteriota bacterium]
MAERHPDNQVDGLYFRRWREDAGLSLRAFCRKYEEATGTPLRDSNLSAMEHGRRPVPDWVIEQGAELIGKVPEDFPEYRVRHIDPSILTDTFADRVLRQICRLDRLDSAERSELRASARLLEIMDEERGYSEAPPGPKGTPKHRRRA